jgi:HD-GYP domain-containing protein (c-di-GMP phosphodiesterase class II)
MRQRIRLEGVSREIEGRRWQAVDLLRIGRDRLLEAPLGDTSVSRTHAELTFVEPLGWYVRDQGSTNGTYLNGVRVGLEHRRIHERDLLQVGNLVLRVVGINEADISTLDSFCGAMPADATGPRSWEQALEVVAGNMAQHTATGAQLMGLLRAGHALHQHDSLDELLRKTLDDALRLLDARSAALLLDDEHTGQLSLQAAAAGENQAAPSYNQTLVHRCFAQGESLLSKDMRDEVQPRRPDSTVFPNTGSVLCSLVRSPQKGLGVLHLARGPQDKPFTVFELHLADAIAANIAGGIESARFFLAKQRSWFIRTVVALAQTMELRDPCTAGHGKRVTRYALLLADALKLPSNERGRIEIGSRLHDIGKIGIRDSVLRKKGRLSAEEYRHMQSHTVKGAAILGAIPELAPILPVIRNHHERWDGRGYPDRLAGEKIPLASRIVAVADAFDAMISRRPYRAGLSIHEAFEQVQRGAGTQFDPRCSKAFLGLKRRIADMLPPAKTPAQPASNRQPADVEAECALLLAD